MNFIRRFFQRNQTSNKNKEYSTKEYYDETFVIPKRVLGAVSIRMTHNLTPLARKCWDFLVWFQVVNVSIAVTLEFISMAVTGSGGTFEDAITVIQMIPCIGVTVVALVRLYKMMKTRPILENIVYEIRNMWPERKLDSEERDIVNTAVKQLMFIVKGYYWCNNALFISFILPTHIESIKRLLGYENEMRTHNYSYWLPFDYYKPVYLDILLLIQTWHAIIVIFSNLAGDLLFCAFLSHITTQFDLLSLRIRRMVYVPVDKQLLGTYPLGRYSKHNKGRLNASTTDAEWEEIQYNELVQIIQRHQTLIRLSGDVEKVFSFSLLLTFLNSSITICMCGFCCVIIEKWNSVGYKSFLVTSLSQTYLICWYGQKLVDSSTGIAHALYNSGWYQAPRRVQESILIMFKRAQKEVHITTYGFSVISLPSYSKIIKTAWSYFTLLINTYK